MQVNPLDIPGTPFEIEMLNPNPSARRTKDGPVYRVSFELSKEAHDCFMTAREGNLRIAARMVVMPDTDEEKAQKALEGQKKPKPSKGPHGALWHALHGAAIWNCPGIREAIEEARVHDQEEPWQVLHRIFDVVSLAEVGAEKIYEEFPPESYPQVRVIVEQAIKKAAKSKESNEP